MVKLRIDDRECEVPEGTTILEAAGKLNIEIHTLCYKKGLPDYSSCMVCVVKNNKTGKFIPSCVAISEDGMDIDASGKEVMELRKKAVELLLSEHRAECEAPCKIVCPVELDIPLMNRLIAKGEMYEAAELAFHSMGFPETMCALCPGFCESACRRNKIDTHIAITGLKKYVEENHFNGRLITNRPEFNGRKIAVIGSGPLGLSIAFHLTKNGHRCVIFEKNGIAGGKLIREFTGKGLTDNMLFNEIEQAVSFGISIVKEVNIDDAMITNRLVNEFDIIVSSVHGLNISYVTEEGRYVMLPGDLAMVRDKYIFTPAAALKNEKSVVRTFGEGKKAAKAVDIFLSQGNNFVDSKRFNSTLGKISETEKLEWTREVRNEGCRFEIISTAAEATSEAGNCMHCDCRAQTECRLRDLAETFGMKNPKEKLINGPVAKKINFSTGLVFENAKCIKCGICVRICNDTVEDPPLCFSGRGFSSIISEPLTARFAEILKSKTGECVEACPTGALTFYDQ